MSKVALILGLLLAAGPSLALERQVIQAGPSQSQDHSTAAVFYQAIGKARDPEGKWTWRPVGTLGFVEGRDLPGNRDDVWLAGGGVRFQRIRADGRVSPLFVETQALLSEGNTNALTGQLQFGTAVGWSGERWEVLVRHLSNAGIDEPNRGETMLLMGYTF